ncbi:MAG: DUF302 domain-containing protein [Candidatus Kapaibacterium sp.]
MSYYFSKIIESDFDSAIEKATQALSEEGFGVLTEINVAETFHKKLSVEFRKYKILGACNPQYAYKAISAEDKIGTMLPCNVIVQEIGPNKIEIAAVDPIASMQAVGAPELGPIAEEVQYKLKKVINSL